MVYAQAVDAVVGGGRGADFAVVDSGRGTSRAIPVDDWEVPRVAGAAGVGCGLGGFCAAVHRCRIARLFARTWESAQPGQHGFVDGGADDDSSGLGGDVLTVARWEQPSQTFLP